MDNFDEIVTDVLANCKLNLQNKIINQELILGLFYIKKYLYEGYKLSSKNHFLINEIINITNRPEYMTYFIKDIKFSIFLLLVKTVQNISLEKKNKKDFFKIYVNFDDFANLDENKDLIKLLFPQDRLSEYLKLFNEIALSHEEFFSKGLLEKEKIIYKFHSLTVRFYERSIEDFKSLFGYLYSLFLKALEIEDEEIIFYLYPSLQFSWNAVATTQEEFKYFNDNVENKLELYIKEKMIKKYNLKPIRRDLKEKETIKVAFLQERFINYSIYKVFYSLLNVLNKREDKKYEFVILDLNFQLFGGSVNTVVDEIKGLGFEYIDCQKETIGINTPFFEYSKKCLALRELIIDKDIDVLIGMHSQPEYNFLFTTRTCPKQVYWTHGNFVYDLKNIDKRIKHGDFTINEIIHNNHTFLQFGDILDKLFLDPNIDKEIIDIEKLKYPKNCLILGTIGRLSKVNSDEYIKLIDEILKENENTIYIAAGMGDENSIKHKIDKNVLSRWFFPGQINPHLYGNIIDIWPNTFPNPQGLSTLEFMAKGKAVLTMKNNFQDFEVQDKHNKQRTDKFKSYNMNVKDFNEYKRSLNFLISNKEGRELMGSFILEYINENYYDSSKSLNRFYEILEEISL